MFCALHYSEHEILNSLNRLDNLLNSEYTNDSLITKNSKKISLLFSKSEAKKIYQTTKLYWYYHFESNQFYNLLQKIVNQEALFFEEHQNLKIIRKRGLLLRYIFTSLDKSHIPPDLLDTWVKTLGKLNDAIVSRRSDLAQINAFKLLQIDKTRLDKAIESFKVSKEQSTQGHLKELAKETLHLLKKDNLKVSEFHQVRKNIRQFQAVLRVQNSLLPSESRTLLIEKIHKINQLTGSIHDYYVSKSLTVDAAIYERETLNIPKDLKKAIKDVLNSMTII